MNKCTLEVFNLLEKPFRNSLMRWAMFFESFSRDPSDLVTLEIIGIEILGMDKQTLAFEKRHI